jgi:hypothetical protein
VTKDQSIALDFRAEPHECIYQVRAWDRVNAPSNEREPHDDDDAAAAGLTASRGGRVAA